MTLHPHFSILPKMERFQGQRGSRWVVACLGGCLAWGTVGTQAQVVVASPPFFQLTPLTHGLGSYATVMGTGSFVALSLNRYSPLSFNATAYAFMQVPSPTSPPPLPFSQVALVRSGSSLVQAPIALGEPEWFADTVDGQPVFTLAYPFTMSFSVPYSSSRLPLGNYEVNLVGGTNVFPVLAFGLVPDTNLPQLKIEAVQGSIRLSWEDASSRDFIGVEESTQLSDWKSLGVYLRSKGSITLPASGDARFYRLTANL